ncbi:sensor histidine kinase [Ampullimonas aquatilis]|uniref:sensor histidine kinase n=1 Tax=Ampullimonas aquatilis TaxID=1341549 RepID=UPI003C72A569
MDLRVRLVFSLGIALVIMLITSLVVLTSNILSDVEHEITATSELIDLVLLANEAKQQGGVGVSEMISPFQLKNLRHVSARLIKPTDSGIENNAESDKWAVAFFNKELSISKTYRIPMGEDILLIQPNAQSELDESVSDVIRIMVAFLLFSLITLLVAWWVAHWALSPVRELLDCLTKLEKDESIKSRRHFQLKEFERIALGIDHLAESLREARHNQKQLTHRLLELQESERKEIARELHDELGQVLTAITVDGAFIERHVLTANPQQIKSCAHNIVLHSRSIAMHVRTLLTRLKPHGLEGLGLLDAMRDLIGSWQGRVNGPTIHINLPEKLQIQDQSTGLVLYRSLQEMLTNVFRHSEAKNCYIKLEHEIEGLRLRIEDDGVGSLSKINQSKGYGLLGLRERLSMVDGQLTITERIPIGLAVDIFIPN